MKKIIAVLTSLVLLAVSASAETTKTTANQFALSLSNETISFISEHNIDKNTLTSLEQSLKDSTNSIKLGTLEETLHSIKAQAENYNFTTEQIAQYIEGLISTPTTIVTNNNTNVASSTDFPISTTRPVNEKGIGYEVESLSGYYEETAFLQLPEVYKATPNGTSAYMFYTVATANESYGVDIGLWYGYGAGGYGWRSFQTIDHVQTAKSALLNVDSGDVLYLQGTIVYGDDGKTYVRCRILNGNNFSDVKSSFCVEVNSQKINKTNSLFVRQIMLCNDNANFNTGEYLHNARFYNAYIYQPVGYGELVSTSNTSSSECGAFGTLADPDNVYKVTINDHEEWWEENISIHFN